MSLLFRFPGTAVVVPSIATIATLSRTLINPNAYGITIGDKFGKAVATNGNYIVVGAEAETSAAGVQVGTVYMFNATTGALVHTIIDPNAYGTAPYDMFGNAVAISGNYMVAAAYDEGDVGVTGSGRVYVFNVATGALLFTLNNPNAYGSRDSDYFGVSLAIDGDYAIAGAFTEDAAGAISAGAAYIFNVTTGALVRTLTNPVTGAAGASNHFGSAVAISGNYAAVSAPDGTAAGGVVHIYNVTTGALIRTLTNPNTFGAGLNDAFGSSISMSGNNIIIGAYQETTSAGGALGNGSGAAYIFDITTGTLLHTLLNPNSLGTTQSDQFGYSVSISTKYAVAGAYNEQGGIGAAYVFDIATGNLLFTLANPMGVIGDQFGYSVSIDGNTVVVGSPTSDTSSGRVYSYLLS